MAVLTDLAEVEVYVQPVTSSGNLFAVITYFLCQGSRPQVLTAV